MNDVVITWQYENFLFVIYIYSKLRVVKYVKVPNVNVIHRKIVDLVVEMSSSGSVSFQKPI